MSSGTSRRGEEGVVALTLAMTLAFALFAVIQLTRTTLAAQQIDDRVDVIVGEVDPIAEDLTNVPKLDQTDEIAQQILAAAQPLAAQAQEINTIARSIDGTVTKIEGNAISINGTVRGIQGNVNTLAPVVRSINDGVAAINGRVDRVIGLVAGIKIDLDNVLAEVGTATPAGHGNPSNETIHGHANSINCQSAVRVGAAPGPGCEGAGT
ncbi:MAG: hypothetical protein KY458_03535 [Actinobacteria bacterium]|nr:hypothetical protein [Actinomycetota bacterium]